MTQAVWATSMTGDGAWERSRADGLFNLYHLEHPHRPPALSVIVAALLVAVFTGFAYHTYGDLFSEQALTVYLCLYGCIVLAWLMTKALRPAPHNWLSPDAVFLLVFSLFHIPFVVFYLTGLADYTTGVFFSPGSVNRAMTAVICTAVAFLAGYELGAFGRRQPAAYDSAPRLPPLCFNVMQGIFLLSFVGALAGLGLVLGPAIFTYGYSGFRRIERFVGSEAARWISIALLALRIGATLYITAAIMRHRKVFKGFLAPVLLLLAIFFFLIVGGRSYAAMMLLPIVLAYHYFVRRIRLRWGIPLLAVWLLLFGVIGISRQAESLSPAELYRAYQDYRQETGVNPFIASLAESGASFRTVVVTCAFIPETESYWFGRSLLNSLSMIVPAPIPGLRTELSPSAWVTLRATGRLGGETAGWGSSIAMEAYMNFGLLIGPMFIAALAFVIRRWYDSMLRAPSFLRVVLVLTAVTCIAMWCRNYSHHFFRPLAWTMVAAWLLWSPFARRSAPDGVPGYGSAPRAPGYEPTNV